MKKILMTLFVATMAMTVNAQVYLGGSVGVGSVKFGHNDAETTYKFMPEIGYNLNSDWAIGVVLGYQKGACKLGNGNYGQDVDTELLQISPYVRYTVFKSNLINAFVDGGVGIGSYKDMGTQFQLGLRPGVAVNLNRNTSFVAHFGFVGFDSFSPKGDGDSSNTVGVDLDGNNITFGLYINF